MLKCHIVRQLLPNYIDGLLDEESQIDVEDHISTCTACGALVKSMQLEVVDSANINANATAVKQVNYLKKLKKKTISTVLLVVLFMLVLVGLLLKIFVFGRPVKFDDMTVAEYTATDNEDDSLLFLLDFELVNGKTLVMDTKYLEGEDGGIIGVILTPREVANNPLDDTGSEYRYGYHLSSGGDFRITIRYKDEKIVYDMNDWINADG